MTHVTRVMCPSLTHTGQPYMSYILTGHFLHVISEHLACLVWDFSHVENVFIINNLYTFLFYYLLKTNYKYLFIYS